MKYQAIIFDVGETLLEHHPSEKQIQIDRIKSLGFAIDDKLAEQISVETTKAAQDQIQKEQNGAPRMPDSDFVSMLDRAALQCIYSGKSNDEYIEKLRTVPLPKQELRIIHGTVEALQKLKEKGLRLGIVSNHRAWLPDYLKEIGLAQFFETIIVSDIVGIEKPDIRIMQMVFDALSLDACSCLYVGDHPFDVLCSKKAGMDCAWINATESVLPESVPYTEDFRIQSVLDLLEFI